MFIHVRPKYNSFRLLASSSMSRGFRTATQHDCCAIVTLHLQIFISRFVYCYVLNDAASVGCVIQSGINCYFKMTRKVHFNSKLIF